MVMRTPSIHPWPLLKASLKTIQPFYGVLLIFSLPLSVLGVFRWIVPESLFSIVGTLYYLSIWSIFSAALVLYIYRKLKGKEISVSQSIQVSIKYFPILLLWKTLSMILILIPLIPRLYFVTWVIMVEGCSVEDAVRRSWTLTKGYGWQIFGSCMVISLGFNAVAFLSNAIVAAMFDVSLVDLSSSLSITYLPGAIARFASVGLNLFLFNPVDYAFNSLIFIYLLELKGHRLSFYSMPTFAAQKVE